MSAEKPVSQHPDWYHVPSAPDEIRCIACGCLITEAEFREQRDKLPLNPPGPVMGLIAEALGRTECNPTELDGDKPWSVA